MATQDFYTILGVPKSASADEIKKAYRKLAHQYHPDKTGGDEAKFKEINEAYQTLSDSQKRAHYDQFGSAPGANGGFGGGQGGFGGFEDIFRGFGGAQGSAGFEDIFDAFGEMFGGGGRRRSDTNRGRDLEIRVDVDFKDSIKGAQHSIEWNGESICVECGGNGAEKGTNLKTCSQCQGSGQIRQQVNSMLGQMMRVVVCPTCDGAGKLPEKNCHVCKGEGRTKSKRSLKITIPPGIKDGETLLARGEGQAGRRGGTAGDLYVRIQVHPDKRFIRIGNDIVYTLPIKVTDAILGAKLSVPTLDGENEVKIEPGTHEGQEVRLRGLGVAKKGDQIVKIKIEIPKSLKGKAKKLVEELAEAL